MTYNEHSDLVGLDRQSLGHELRRCEIAQRSSKQDSDVDGIQYYAERQHIIKNMLGGDAMSHIPRDMEKHLRIMPYPQYLQTEHWKSLRMQVIERDDWRCQSCHDTTDNPQVHHLTYDRRGKELLEDLITICPSCHRAIHNLDELDTW